MLALYPAGIIFYDWVASDWGNLTWQLGGFACLLLVATLWPRWRAARKPSARKETAD